MTTLNPEQSQDTRRRLMEAALVVFAEKGFDGAGIREIADHAKANSAMVQYHFGGKEGLYREALRFAFQQGPKRIHRLEPLPEKDDPHFRERALNRLKGYLSSFLEEMLECPGSGKYLSPEIERAAHTLWNREMQNPRPSMEEFLVESIRPYSEYLEACLRALRPDLDPESIFRMAMSIHAQVLYLHNHRELTRLLRGSFYTQDELESLIDHFIQFSLRGLGIPEAFPPQGA